LKWQAKIAVRERPVRPVLPVRTALDQRLLYESRTRLVLSGDSYELYRYSEPYFFNKAPEKSGVSFGSTPAKVRRQDNLRVVRQRLRRIVAANVRAFNEVPKFVTYTFARNVVSLREANRLWRLFAKRLTYEMGFQPYTVVVEFQKRGAVHYHALYYGMAYRPRLKAQLADLWGHGFVHVKGIAHVRNVPAYLTKYLQKDLVDARLTGQKAYFCSRGLNRPIELRHEADIALALDGCMLAQRLSKTYESAHFGTIIYTQGVIPQDLDNLNGVGIPTFLLISLFPTLENLLNQPHGVVSRY